jgi:hypothetical protein
MREDILSQSTISDLESPTMTHLIAEFLSEADVLNDQKLSIARQLEALQSIRQDLLGPDMCICRKCDDQIRCEHDKNEPHIESRCGNCI